VKPTLTTPKSMAEYRAMVATLALIQARSASLKAASR
jgi:hypothetical protein